MTNISVNRVHSLQGVSVSLINQLQGEGVAFLVRYFQKKGLNELASYLDCSPEEAVVKLDEVHSSFRRHIKLRLQQQKEKDLALFEVEMLADKKARTPVPLRNVGVLGQHTRVILNAVDTILLNFAFSKVFVGGMPEDPKRFSVLENIWVYVTNLACNKCKKSDIFPDFVTFWDVNFSDVSSYSFPKEFLKKKRKIVRLLSKSFDELIESYRKGEYDRSRVTVIHIQRVVAAEYGITVTCILSSKRVHDMTLPRQVAMYLAKKLTPRSLPRIGREFGRDHTTVLHGIGKIEKLMMSDSALAQKVFALELVILE